MDLILYAVPVFFVLIAIELLFERAKGTQYYRTNDALTSLTTGVINQITNIIKLIVPFTIYVFVHQHLAIVTLSDSIVVWLIAFILYDFFYYWNHRVGHEMNVFWAAHVVHHSSEHYNLTTALRQTGSGFLSVIFYLPMAVMGFDPAMVLTVGALNLIYQFWVHTQHIGKLGWYERYFVTPSNHRAHHAQNAIYIDCNYGGVFIIWDRLFGSYQEEREDDKPIFGIRDALNSWNPIWANLQFYSQLWQDAMHTNNRWHALTLWFRRTGWRPPDVLEAYPIKKTDLSNFTPFDTPLPRWLMMYCIVQYITTILISFMLTINVAQLSIFEQLSGVAFVLFSAFSIGAILEHRHFAGVLEWLRVGILLLMSLLLPLPQSLSLILLVLTLGSAPMLLLGRHQVTQLSAASVADH